MHDWILNKVSLACGTENRYVHGPDENGQVGYSRG